MEVRDLRVGYGAIPVLQGISFDVDEGKTTVLLGLNGAGKTTTVTTIAGLLKPWAGQSKLKRLTEAEFAFVALPLCRH